MFTTILRDYGHFKYLSGFTSRCMPRSTNKYFKLFIISSAQLRIKLQKSQKQKNQNSSTVEFIKSLYFIHSGSYTSLQISFFYKFTSTNKRKKGYNVIHKGLKSLLNLCLKRKLTSLLCSFQRLGILHLWILHKVI